MSTTTDMPHARPRLPLLGDLASLDRQTPTQHESRLVEQLGPIYERKVLNQQFYIVGGGRLATVVNDDERFARAAAGPTNLFRRVAARGLFTARTSDPLWGQARRVLGPGFASAAMHTYHEAMASVADEMLGAWSPGRPVDVHRTMIDATVEVIARAGFSRELGLFAEDVPAESAEFLATFAEILAWAQEASNDLPGIGAVRSAWRERRLQPRIARVREFIDTLITDRAAGRTRAAGSDLLGLMLETSDPETGQRLPPENVRDQVFTFLLAGHETTAALMESTLWYLATRPEWVAEIRDEALERGFSYQGVAGMRVTKQVLNEVLRLCPPVPAYFRIARHDQLLAGFPIGAGKVVSIVALAAQRDPQVWGHTAHEFDPTRWDRLREYPDRFFSPFGTGPRSCIGRAFAIHEATLMTARIAAAFDLRLTNSTTHSGGHPEMVERGTIRPAPYTLTPTEVSVQERMS